MSKFVVNNYNSSQPTLQGESMTMSFDGNGTITSVVKNGQLTNGKVIMPVSGTVVRYDDGRISVNGEFIDWAAITRQQQQQPQPQQPALKLPDEMPNEPPLRDDEKPCVICMERSIKTAIVDCGHQIYCVTCAREHVKPTTLCPLCRVRVTGVIRLYEA
jgi:hypothetical protein